MVFTWGKWKESVTCRERCCPCGTAAPAFWSVNWAAALFHLANGVATLALWANSEDKDDVFTLTENIAPWVATVNGTGLKNGTLVCPAKSEDATRIFQISEEWCIERSQVVTAEVSLWWLVIVFHLLSFLFQAAAMIQGTCDMGWCSATRNYIEEVEKDGTNVLRMVEYSISASLMQLAIALILGIWDRLLLGAIGALTAITMLLGLISEQLRVSRLCLAWFSHLLGWFSMLSVWTILGRQFLYTIEKGTNNPPDFVYTIVIAIGILYCGFGLIQMAQLCSRPSVQSNRNIEMAYCVASLSAKSILGWLLFANALSGMAQS